jgi:hypothetical protein
MKNSKKTRAFIGAAVVALAVVAGCDKKDGGHFGEAFTDAPQVTLAQLEKTPEAFARKSVRVTGTIERQCPASGCWFFLNDGQGQSIKVELGDYLPKLPQNVGNRAEVEGEWIKKGDHHEFIGTRVTFSRPH